MNPGYISFVVLLAIGILLGSGWKEYFFKGWSYKSILIFIAGWLICSFIKLSVPIQIADIQLNAVFIFLLLFSLYGLISIKSVLERLNIITVSLVLCFMDFTFREVSGMALGFTAICLAFAAAGLQKNPSRQLICLLLGFLCSNLVSLLTHQHTRSFILADQSYQDLWWLTILLSLLIGALYENSVISLRKWYSGIFEKK